jgi:hypothetical protein
MSKTAKTCVESVECLFKNIAEIRCILDGEPNLECFHKLEEMSNQALNDISPIHDYCMSLENEFLRSPDRRKWRQDNPDKGRDYFLLFHPIWNAHLFLDYLSFGALGFRLRSAGVRQKGITQDAADFIVQFGRFWEENRKFADRTLRELQTLISKLT